MQATKPNQLIGRTGVLQEDELAFAVEVRDVRQAGERTEYLVIPRAGQGSAWVAAERVTLDGVH